jgi:3-hydroxyacyl-[acyl-carrier-protein] dehydratase
MPPTTILDPTQIDFSRIVADAEAIEAVNPHRHGMRMIDAVVLIDRQEHLIVGYRDCRDDEFWVPGHMPGYPLFPGVLMVEASAQLTCYYTKTHGILGDELLGLAGIDNARFRGPVRPGDRLVLVGKGRRVDRRRSEFAVQGYVGSTMVFNLEVMGVPIPGRELVAFEGEACMNGVGG